MRLFACEGDPVAAAAWSEQLSRNVRSGKKKKGYLSLDGGSSRHSRFAPLHMRDEKDGEASISTCLAMLCNPTTYFISGAVIQTLRFSPAGSRIFNLNDFEVVDTDRRLTQIVYSR
jgi:hypothetical protein